MLKLRRAVTTLTVLLMITSLAPLTPAITPASAAGIGFSDPVALTGSRHGEPGVRVQRNDLAGGDTSGDRVWVHAFESGWRSDNGGRNWTGEIGTSLALSGDSDMAWGYPGGPNPERIYKTELAQLACEQFFWDDDGSGGAAVTDWMRDDANCGLPLHDRQWLQTGPAVLPDGSILPGAEHVYMIANQIPAGGFLARATQVAPAQPPHFDFTTPFQAIASNQVLWCTRGFFDVDQTDGSIHIVDCLESGALRIYSSYDGGLTWAEEQVANHRNSTNLFPVVSVDDEGGLHVSSSQANGDLLYSYRPEDGPWTEPVTIVAGEGPAANPALKTTALAWVDAGEGGKANLVYLGTTAGPTPDGVKPPNQWHLWMSQTLDGGQTWSHAQADPHAVQTGCISTAGLPITGQPECPNRNLVDFIAADHLSDGSAVISYTYGCNGPTGCDGVTGQSNGAQTRVVVQDAGTKIRGEGPVGQAELSITSPDDGATVQAGVVEVSGTVDRQAGAQDFIANLSGPEDVSTNAAATYSLTATNPQGDLSCSITAEGSPTRANETANGCSVQLTWQNEGSYTVTGEVSDGTSTALDSVQVTVTRPGGIPEPDGSINGGITMFADANPLLAANELAALAASAVDPAPKFLPGEDVTFHTRFTEDSSGAVATSGDTFKWHVWNAAGEQVGTMPCVTTGDGDLTAPNGFDCVASATLPSDIGRYYTTLQYTKDGRWSCHGAGPLENLAVPNGIPQCLKAFDIVANTSSANPGASPAIPREALSYLVAKGADISSVEWALRSKGAKTAPALTAEPTAAPSTVPEDPEVVDPQGDALQVTNPGAGLPVDHLDVEAAWFEDDDDFLYVGLKLNDIPADSNSTAFAAYHVNFRPDWIADPKGAFAVPAANTYTGLRVQGLFSPVGFNGLTNPGTEAAHRAELQVLSTSATGNNFAKVSDLQLLSVDPDSDIVWWSVPRTALLNPQPGDALENLSADSALAMRGQFTLRADLATAVTGRTFEFSGAVEQLVANAGGPYSGPVGAPIAISGSATGGKAPYSCAWTGPALATFGDAGACTTTVSLASPGAHQVELTVTDVDGTTSTSSATVTAGAVTGERVEIYVGGSLAGASAISTDAGNPTADWTVPVDLSGLSGQYEITARWFDGESLLDEGAITLNVEEVGPEFEINITSPSDGAEVGEDFVIEGTTSEIAPSTQGQGSRSAGKWRRAVTVIPADNLKVTSHGPPVPADSVGIGPGSTLLTNFIDPADDGEYVGICTAAFIFKDPNTGKVYIGAAGHCFVAPDAVSSHGPGANWDRELTLRVRVCVETCIGGASGLLSAATLDMYPGTTRDLGELAYARQTHDGVDIGNDFGIVEIPPALHDEIRTDLPVWGGPNTSQPLQLEGGDFLAQYGNGIGVGEVFPTKARMGMGAGMNGGSWLATMASSQGDSGSAVVGANVTVGTASSVDGLAPLGMLTHLSCCLIAGQPYNTAGTTIARALDMARQDAGIQLELIHDGAQLETAPPQAPSGLTAAAGDGTVGLSWTAPSNGGAPISGYTVKWGTQAGGPYENSRTVPGTEATIDDLTNGVTYHFVVSATNSKGEGPNSTEVSATPSRLTTVPGAPRDLSSVAGDGQAALSWQAPESNGGEAITGYTVKWGPTAGGPYPNTFQTTDTTATVTGLTNGLTYHFVVTANNVNGESANSNEVAVTPEAIGDRFAVEVRLGTSGEWTTVDAYDGSAWSKAFTDVADGEVTIEARLLERGTEVARDSIGLIVDGTEVTTVAFTDGSADGGQFGDQARIAARLTDEAGGPIPGAELVFEMTGASGVQSWAATTNDQGVASAQRTLTGAPGTYNLTVHFAGAEGVYEPHSDQRFFVIEKEGSVTDLVVTGKGSKRKLTATLAEDDGPALAGREIVFYVEGTEIGRATTNANGVATLAPPTDYRGDHFNFEARFDGTDNYKGSGAFYQT